MKKTGVILRILCAGLDAMIVMIPIQFVMLGVFGVSTGQADLLFKLLLAVYGALLSEYWGHTAGKYFGKLRCADVSGEKPAILYMGLRELVKAMYFIPVAGWLAGAVSIVMMTVREDGRTLHDLAGNTKVVYSWQMKEAKSDAE